MGSSFDSSENEFVVKNPRFVAGSAIVAVLSAAMIIAYFVSRYRYSKALSAANAAAQISKEAPSESSDTNDTEPLEKEDADCPADKA